MTLGTACRGILIAGLIFCFVAINAQFIHDFFLLKLPDILKLADCTRFLGEHGMAGIAVFESVLSRRLCLSVQRLCFRPPWRWMQSRQLRQEV
jgi:hypothetical protein